MCQFFSLLSDGAGEIYFFDAEIRKKILAGDLPRQDTDSHSAIATHFFPETNGGAEDGMNKYEYNPLTRELTIDQLNTTDDAEEVEIFCNGLNFSTIVPELVIKPILRPFENDGHFSEKALNLLKAWASVWALVRASVGASVWDLVGDSVWDLVRTSVWDSVGASVWAYVSSFFRLGQWKYFESLTEGVNPFQSAIDLWELGLVPSFDGKTWRLHAKSGIVWEGKI